MKILLYASAVECTGSLTKSQYEIWQQMWVSIHCLSIVWTCNNYTSSMYYSLSIYSSICAVCLQLRMLCMSRTTSGVCRDKKTLQLHCSQTKQTSFWIVSKVSTSMCVWWGKHFSNINLIFHFHFMSWNMFQCQKHKSLLKLLNNYFLVVMLHNIYNPNNYNIILNGKPVFCLLSCSFSSLHGGAVFSATTSNYNCRQAKHSSAQQQISSHAWDQFILSAN